MLSRLPLQTTTKDKADVFNTVESNEAADGEKKEEKEAENGSDDDDDDADMVDKTQLSMEERLKKFHELLEEKKVRIFFFES